MLNKAPLQQTITNIVADIQNIHSFQIQTTNVFFTRPTDPALTQCIDWKTAHKLWENHGKRHIFFPILDFILPSKTRQRFPFICPKSQTELSLDNLISATRLFQILFAHAHALAMQLPLHERTDDDVNDILTHAKEYPEVLKQGKHYLALLKANQLTLLQEEKKRLERYDILGSKQAHVSKAEDRFHILRDPSIPFFKHQTTSLKTIAFNLIHFLWYLGLAVTSLWIASEFFGGIRYGLLIYQEALLMSKDWLDVAIVYGIMSLAFSGMAYGFLFFSDAITDMLNRTKPAFDYARRWPGELMYRLNERWEAAPEPLPEPEVLPQARPNHREPLIFNNGSNNEKDEANSNHLSTPLPKNGRKPR